MDPRDVVIVGAARTAIGRFGGSGQPFLSYDERSGFRLGDRTALDGALSLVTDPFAGYPMSETGERVAERFGIDRESQDAFPLESQRRTAAAVAAGRFEAQIEPVVLARGDRFDRDEHPRPDVTAERLARLQPVFRPDGTVTAGNSSGMNDGAAALVLVSSERARAGGHRPLGRFVAAAVTGIEPEIMGYGPVAAIARCLDRADLGLDAVDVIELNEAFASQALAVIRDASLDASRVNPNGGAIALGHPVGATGGDPGGEAPRRAGPGRRSLRAGHDVHRRRPGHGPHPGALHRLMS